MTSGVPYQVPQRDFKSDGSLGRPVLLLRLVRLPDDLLSLADRLSDTLSRSSFRSRRGSLCYRWSSAALSWVVIESSDSACSCRLPGSGW